MSMAAIALSAGLLGGRSPQVTLGTLGVLLAQFVRVLLLGGPLEEELGWRGFALPRLQARLPALDASILLGIVWGAWHIPLYFVPGTGQSETLAGGADPGFTIGGFVFWTTGLSVLFTWLFNQSSGSLLVAMLLHTSVDIGALLPSAVGSGGASSYLYVLITWIAAIAVTLRLGRKSLATAGRQVVSEPVEQRGRRDPGS
jgi:membrane protease YdiL (CAAX protease family)